MKAQCKKGRSRFPLWPQGTPAAVEKDASSGDIVQRPDWVCFTPKRTSVTAAAMSALGQKRKSRPNCGMSALAPRADIERPPRHVRFVPYSDSCTAAITFYSITWSAIASNVAGTVMPSALAVLRLMTRENLLAWSIGRSPGFAPRNIFAA